MANLSINSTRVTRVKSPEPRPSSLPSKTASLNDTMGIPGWQIVHDGDLPVLTLSGGAQSLIGYGAVQSLSADSSVSSSASNTHSNERNGLNHHLTIIIISTSISVLILTMIFTTLIFIKRNKRRRERNFELNTMELKRKSTLWNHSSKT